MPVSLIGSRVSSRNAQQIRQLAGNHEPPHRGITLIHLAHVGKLSYWGVAKSFRPDKPIAKDVMWIGYGEPIPRSTPALFALERRLRSRPIGDRVKLLRLLKTRTICSVPAAAPVLGYSARQLQRWWATYTSRGLEALVRWQPRPSRHA
jgi:hypothetical protein